VLFPLKFLLLPNGVSSDLESRIKSSNVVIAVGLFGTIFTKILAASQRVSSDLESRIKSSNVVIAVGYLVLFLLN
jgi:hypothetical protein